MFPSRALRISLIIIVMFAVAGAASALAAANTVDTSAAGDGAGAISGFDVSGIVYDLDDANPRNIAQVTFDLDVTAADVMIQLDPAGDWYDCTVAGTDVTCTTTGATVESATNLRVVAGDIVP